MLLARVRAMAILLAVMVITGYGYQSSPVNRPWPPGVQQVSPESPVLPAAEAVKTFFMAPGYRVELVASEPLVQDPIAMDWDPQGRLWVVEMPGFVPDLAAPEPNMDPVGRIVVLEDTDRDGAMDKRTVFADGLVLARSLKVLDRGVLVAEPPNVWLMRDTDGDLRMDAKDLVTDVFGSRQARVEQNANEFYWALDNQMHTAESDVYLRLRNGRFEVLKTLARGEWGVTQDDAGRIYRNTNESALHVDFVPTPYFARNPSLLRTRGSYEALRDEDNAVNTVWPVRPNPGTNRAYQRGIDREDGTLAKFTAVCAPVVYRGDRLPAELAGNVFVAEPAANLVSRLVVEDDGTTLRARKAYERGEFLASTDERFRPVYLTNAPDGTLYITDMYRGVIQQRADITEYLRDYIVEHKLEKPIGLGRIYRVVHETTRRDAAPVPTRLSSAQLVERLSHPNGWWRDTAQRLLVERGDKSMAPALTALAQRAGDWRPRLHALWTLDGLDALDQAAVLRGLQDESRDVRASAVRLAERWLGDAPGPLHAAVAARLDDKDWAVRHQLAASLGAMAAPARDAAMVALIDRHGDDPITLDAVLSGLRGSEMAVLEKLTQPGAAPTPQREAAVTMFAATIVRGAQDVPVQALFGKIAEGGRADWQRAAMLRGAEVAVLGAAMPGMPARRGGPAPASAPCPTCPGARGGPGGSYAFRDPAVVAAAAAARERGNARVLRLNREPAALAGLVATGGMLGPRAEALLGRIEWPGKPGLAAPLPPLTPDEQRRVNAGQEVYRNVCQACHQPDGRGMERLAPPLVESPLALGPPEVAVRILLHGKEGPVGLMPPVGQVFNDEQIASVLTYIRREWGHMASTVDPATVKAVRASTSGRSRPWTTDELAALAGGGR
jgi:mono/diheme cytochrome c family protein/glucose/arabinose dehydrogenase